MKISTLRCELSTEEEVGHMGVIAQVGSMKYLWQVFINNELVSRRAMPFGPSDEWIELEADRDYPISGDGHRWVWVRQAGDFIVWFRPPAGDPLGGYHPGLEDDELYVFELGQYREATLACIYQDSPALYRTVQNSNAHLQQLNEYELSQILDRSLPKEDDPIYTVPKIPADLRGRKLILRAKEYLIDVPQRRFRADAPLREVPVCQVPTEIVEVQIGLDLIFEFPESIWRFGKVDQGIAVCFISRPCFPVWICGEHIDAAFSDLVNDLLEEPA